MNENEVSYEEIVTLIAYHISLNFEPNRPCDDEFEERRGHRIWFHHESNHWFDWCICLSSVGVTTRIDPYRHAWALDLKLGEQVPVQRHSGEAPIEAFLEILAELHLNDLYEGRWDGFDGIVLSKYSVQAALASTFRNPPAKIAFRKLTSFSGTEFLDHVMEWLILCSFGAFYRLGMGEIDEAGNLRLSIRKCEKSNWVRGDHTNCVAFTHSVGAEEWCRQYWSARLRST